LRIPLAPVVAHELISSRLEAKPVYGLYEYGFGFFRATESGKTRREREAKREILRRLRDGAFHQFGRALGLSDGVEKARDVADDEAVPRIFGRAVLVKFFGSLQIPEVVLREQRWGQAAAARTVFVTTRRADLLDGS